MIIETSDNRFYKVEETGDADLAHVWFGTQVKRVKGEWVLSLTRRKGLRRELVRKAATRVVEA